MNFFECVINIAHGRYDNPTQVLVESLGSYLKDLHVDNDYWRSVYTIVASESEIFDVVVGFSLNVLELLSFENYSGLHPAIGILDVVPFVPIPPASMDKAVIFRNQLGKILSEKIGLPIFFYGPERSLPEIRKNAFRTLSPDWGPSEPLKNLGASAIGAREILVAYNLYVNGVDFETLRVLASKLRSPGVRAIPVPAKSGLQLSFNLVDPFNIGPKLVYEKVAMELRNTGGFIARAELVGLCLEKNLREISFSEYEKYGLNEEKTIESKL